MRVTQHTILLLTLAIFPLAASTGPGAEALVTPEPSTWLLMGTGVGGLLVRAILRSRKKT
jgi:PEP-CTERM motif-containing protein